ncbi:uncharacterized protein LOC135192917 [Pogoniulus pusillus]|uniref:uncharacterized protein LOC135192917 n=1 Tax=Pogoniulus pusillus TaxID=488313 RepID=UPI0030B9A2F2
MGNLDRPGLVEVITNWPEGTDCSKPPEEKITRAEEAPPYGDHSDQKKNDALFTDGSCRLVGNKRRWQYHQHPTLNESTRESTVHEHEPNFTSLTLKAMATVERLFCLLEAHGARPSVEGLDWARENWSTCQSVMDRIVALQKEARAKSGKGKAFICAVLGTCLAASIDEKQSQNGRENKIISSLQELVDSLQGHIVTLKDEVADLKDRLKTEQKWQRWFLKEEELKQTEPGSIYPQAELAAAEEAAAHMRPLIKTEMLYEDEDGTPAITTKEIPFSSTELAKLRKEFTRSSGESEVEYVWRVSRTGGDQIRLTEAEATGYWGANVFLTTGNRSGPWSLTQRAAFWAGGFDSKERGEPLVLRGGMNQIMENVQKAACLQMVYDRELKHHFESPLSLLVDPKRMTPLVRGLPDSLKMKGIQLQKEIADTPLTSRIQATLRENLTPGRNQPDGRQWTWEEVARELLDYARQYGVPEEVHKPETRGLRHVEINHPLPSADPRSQMLRIPKRHSTGGREHLNTRQYWWGLGRKKGIPKEVIDGLSSVHLEIVVKNWPESSQKPEPTAPPLIDLSDVGKGVPPSQPQRS